MGYCMIAIASKAKISFFEKKFKLGAGEKKIKWVGIIYRTIFFHF